MSFVTLVVIKNRTFRLYKKHYGEIIEIIRQQKFNGNCFLLDYFDDGYLIVDFDGRRIFNSQSCFDPKKEAENLKKFELLNI